MDPLEAGAAHQATPQWIIDNGAPTVGHVQQGTGRPRKKDRHKAHMQLGEVIPVTGEMPVQGGVMWVKGETLTAIRIAGMHRIQSLRQDVRTLKRDTQGMLRQWPQPLNPQTGPWSHSLQGYPEPMNAVKSLEGSLRNQGAIKTNLMAVLIPG